MANGPKHVYEVEIEAPPEKVWEALNDPKQEFIAGWTLEYDDGGPGYTCRDERGEAVIVGVALEMDPPRRLVATSSHQWSEEVRSEQPSRVTYELTPTRKGCRLTVIHDGFESDASPTYRAVEGGWPLILDALKAFVEGRPEVLAEALMRQGSPS